MKMILKLIIACILCLMGILLLYILGVFLFALITEFIPPDAEKIAIQDTGKNAIPYHQEMSILTWNIGYAGLGREMDFFYEGGNRVRPEKLLSKKYLDGIIDFLIKHDTTHVFLLQEVDFDSRRSYFTDQSYAISSVIDDYNKTAALNYSVRYVPVPYFNPMGKVSSGLVTYSFYKPEEATRFSTPGKYTLPKRLFMLKRCFLATRFTVDNGKELVLINLHNSAFEDAEELRKSELVLLKQLLIAEYEKGNYVLAGGDWNQNPPGTELKNIQKYKARSVWPIGKDYLPEDWSWAYDPTLPTNRDVNEPFDSLTTTCTILDYFVCSPNITVIETKTMDLGFDFSDHQPVIIKIKLN